MAVVIETTLGDITVDLYLDQRPVTCLNFLKLCKMKYYNYNLFHSIRSGFIAQTGDPTGEGSGGQSIWGILEGPQKRFFSGEKMPKIRHTGAGLLSMVCTDDMMVGSQFFLTLAADLDSLDGTHCVIGEVTEGHEVLSKLNEVICDESHRPYRDVRITHTVVLEDPFNDPPGLWAPSRSPSPNAQRLKGGRIAPDEEIDETEGKTAEEIQEMIDEKEAKARATILEIVGDLPDADIAPPENVLFVCKLNPVTTDDDLEIIFSRFGTIVSCEVIRDKKTGNSLQYAFIEFDNKKSCEDAYLKMDNVLIDDRRIHVDFSQSVSKMRWLGKGRGVQYFDDDKSDISFDRKDKSKQPSSRDRENYRHKDHNAKHDDRKYERNDSGHSDRRHRNDRHQNNNKSQRERSRSRSRLEDSRSYKRDRPSRRQSKDRDNDDKNFHRYRNDHNGTTVKSDKTNLCNKRTDRRNKSASPHRRSKIESREKHERNEDNHRKTEKIKNDERSKERSSVVSKTKGKSKVYDEPKTPSPILDKKKDKSKAKLKNKKTEESKPKKKRKVSTSSSDSSSGTGSSTESSSSSSESDRKKKRIKRKRRKSSTSSSSSSSSSSSESSSDTSTSSSNSEADKKKRKKKVQSKKTAKKSKK